MTPEKDGQLVVDMEDEVIRGATVCKDGETTWPPPAPKLSAAPPKPAPAPAPTPVVAEEKKRSVAGPVIGMFIAGFALLGLGYVAPPSFMAHFTVFVLACFVGYMVIWNVTAALHTPLMSVTNAISSIIVIGALLQVSSENQLVMWIAVGTVGITAVNIFGGFAVTRRMLEMFRK
jgi:NAD(P) transhydrogenase subunit alpha